MKFERQKYEHKETLELGKYFYTTIFKLERVPFRLNRKRALDSLFGRIFYGEPVPTSPENALAPMTFAFNATLLLAFQFLLQSKTLNPEILAALPKDILVFGSVSEILPKLIGIFGIIYNIGAWVSYTACSRIALNLTQHFIMLDKQLGAKISTCGTKKSDYIYGLFSSILTNGFFVAWVLWWSFYMWKITPALSGLTG